MSSAFLKRLEAIGAAIGARNARTFVISVPTQLTPIDVSVEMDAVVTPETRAAVDEIRQALGIGDQDTVIEVARFTDTLPELVATY